MSLFLLFLSQNGFVECEPEQCPSVDECYFLEKKNDGCCRRCKGKTLYLDFPPTTN